MYFVSSYSFKIMRDLYDDINIVIFQNEYFNCKDMCKQLSKWILMTLLLYFGDVSGSC